MHSTVSRCVMRPSAMRDIRKGAAMRQAFLIACGLVLSVGPSLAQDAKDYTGEWQVENKAANIKIDNCGGSLWGVVSWEVKAGLDSENPDPALRSRPTLG